MVTRRDPEPGTHPELKDGFSGGSDASASRPTRPADLPGGEPWNRPSENSAGTVGVGWRAEGRIRPGEWEGAPRLGRNTSCGGSRLVPWDRTRESVSLFVESAGGSSFQRSSVAPGRFIGPRARRNRRLPKEPDASRGLLGPPLFDMLRVPWAGIGHSSCLPAQRPGMDVMLNPYGEPRGGRWVSGRR